MLSAAQLLDELMGRDRNLAPDEKRTNVHWDHESVSLPCMCGSRQSLFPRDFGKKAPGRATEPHSVAGHLGHIT
ncbi:hypothetical protein XELAEV_18011508mg [Xenopus laevis]|uniref:Uncharacterized protein n=1 Tax=Xenopus laevis TaxID=8355 RepID=A0A974DNG9_XENLA|nr:hypothetical protein XELAEV_18011508mg [Xenopus laevis]